MNWMTRVGLGYHYSNGSEMVTNARTAAMLRRVEDRLGYQLTIAQGSYHVGVAASAGTHDGGGCVDLAPFDAANKVRACRLEGFAAWHRLAIPNVWPEHIHAVAIGDPELASLARDQVVAYYHGYNGLGYKGLGGPDNGPRFDPIPITGLTEGDFMPITDWPAADRQKLRDMISAEGKALIDDIVLAVLEAPVNKFDDAPGSEIEFRGVSVREAIKAAARGHIPTA
jgi:hypothetical protein